MTGGCPEEGGGRGGLCGCPRARHVGEEGGKRGLYGARSARQERNGHVTARNRRRGASSAPPLRGPTAGRQDVTAEEGPLRHPLCADPQPADKTRDRNRVKGDMWHLRPTSCDDNRERATAASATRPQYMHPQYNSLPAGNGSATSDPATYPPHSDQPSAAAAGGRMEPARVPLLPSSR